MNLFGETVNATRWVGSVLRVFFGVRPWTTLALVVSVTIGRFAGLLAFFLPLKVILLAGSDGVPRYFAFFIESADKMPWIMGLSVGAVGFYILSLAMSGLANKLSEAGSSEVLQGANEIAVASKQREEVQGYYSQFSGIVSDFLLVVISFVVLYFIDVTMLLLLLGLIASQYLLTALVLDFEHPVNPGRFPSYIRDNISGYLDIWGSVNFLSCFFAILIPILMGHGGNLLLAILSVLLLRRSIGALTSSISSMCQVYRSQQKIDPLVFRDRQIHRREKSIVRDLRRLFRKEEREKIAQVQLERAGFHVKDIASEWKDSKVKGAYTFRVRLDSAGGEAEYLQQQVFAPNQRHMLEHEDYLFEKISRERVLAPSVKARYSVGQFEVQLCDYGLGRPCGKNKWKHASRKIMTHLWSVEPPKSLVSAFNTSRPTLEGRLTEEYLQSIEVALDYPEQVGVYENVLSKLPFIRSLLHGIPVYIYNPELTRFGVADFGRGDCRVMSWGRWSIEPIGAAILNPIGPDEIEESLGTVRKERSIKEKNLTVDHVYLAYECRELERDIGKGAYERSVDRLSGILGNKLVGDVDL